MKKEPNEIFITAAKMFIENFDSTSALAKCLNEAILWITNYARDHKSVDSFDAIFFIHMVNQEVLLPMIENDRDLYKTIGDGLRSIYNCGGTELISQNITFITDALAYDSSCNEYGEEFGKLALNLIKALKSFETICTLYESNEVVTT